MKHEARGGLNKSSPSKPPSSSDASHAGVRQIHLLQRTKGKPGAGLGKTTGWIHRAVLTKGGVNMRGGVQEYVKVRGGGVMHST
jgi:2,4-dienoyl-CoA reductase (NADPH2)